MADRVERTKDALRAALANYYAQTGERAAEGDEVADAAWRLLAEMQAKVTAYTARLTVMGLPYVGTGATALDAIGMAMDNADLLRTWPEGVEKLAVALESDGDKWMEGICP